jgi:hypothetical protein
MLYIAHVLIELLVDIELRYIRSIGDFPGGQFGIRRTARMDRAITYDRPPTPPPSQRARPPPSAGSTKQRRRFQPVQVTSHFYLEGSCGR